MFTKREKCGLTYYISPLFDRHGIKHAFFTRFGGASSGVFSSLNASLVRKDKSGKTDSVSNVFENYRRALSVFDIPPADACSTAQVHSCTVLGVSSADAGCGIIPEKSAMPDCDGLILRNAKEETGTVSALCIKTADCVPILLANKASGDICAVHAGWRGSAGDIVTAALEKLGAQRKEDIIAAIGPCIGRCCYEIGIEVETAFKRLFASKKRNYNTEHLLPLRPVCSASEKRHADLAMINKELIMLWGVSEDNIDLSGICTCCYKEKGVRPFFSHRGENGYSGTFLSIIAL